MLHAQGRKDKEGDAMNDNEDYELASLMFGIGITLLILFAVTGIAGLAGYLWGIFL